MFTARMALAIGKFYHEAFTAFVGIGTASCYRATYSEKLFEFFVAKNYEPWFCDMTRQCSNPVDVRDLFVNLERRVGHGPAAEGMWRARQTLLQRTGEDILSASGDEFAVGNNRCTRERQRLIASLELDGYAFRDGRILRSEGERQEVEQERGELEAMYAALGLGSADTVKHHLKLCEEHYAAGGDKAGDSIHNARQFLEQILEDIAVAWSARPGSGLLPKELDALRAVHVRDYLRGEGLLSKEEHDAFAKFYGLLSASGGHLGVSRQNQARVYRRLALSMAIYAMLVFEARIGSSASAA